MKFAYYPGCTLKTTAKNFEVPTLAALEKLGVELVELPRWNCCGTVYSLASDDLMHHIAPIRNLIRVKEAGENKVVTLCAMCYNTLKRSNLRIRENEEDRDKINNFMDREEIDYEGDVEVLHLLEILKDGVGFDKIKENIKNSLDELKVAPYYGCLLLRPDEAKIDDPENPTIMENFIRSVGAEPIDFPYKNECCGAYHTVNELDLVVERTHAIIGYAKNAGADVVLTSCPLCEFNLDRRQKEVKEKFTGFQGLPVLYFTQLLSIALGLDQKYYRFDLNYVDPSPVLKRYYERKSSEQLVKEGVNHE
jgi:heterodisulfide reductase subunit B